MQLVSYFSNIGFILVASIVLGFIRFQINIGLF